MYILERGMECLPQVLSYLDDEFCQSWKDLHSHPAPPVKADFSKGDQLSFVSDMLLEDHDMQLNWNCALFRSDDDDDDGGGGGGGGHPDCPIMESGEDGLWRCMPSDKSLEEMLSDMDTSIFEGLVGSPLDCHNLMESQETGEATSDYCSNGDASAYTSSDSEEEIDVVTVGRCPSRQQQEEEEEERRLRALQRRLYFDIQLQHNYAAPPPASPPPPSSNRHCRRHYEQHHSAETEDEEEERRRTHNVMERQRRNELKNCFVRLRDNVPELSRNDKASKAVILKKARDCIHGLENNSYRLQAKRDKLRAKQEELKARLRHLRLPVRS
ncbi:transcriptional regulator Myc-A-like [Hippocampus zosterae]|uniref:transcriptional regulator Myc-A-like n=1 Tax=Hippocampus zosterae TaxID=109293 RepID=UPI00223E6B61|nr:transcriptional regulator Myc-A-like [Hippocampus zosterae]